MTSDDLKRVSYMLIKEGEAYEQQAGKFLMDWFDNSPTINLHTSGTTGAPKVMEFPKQALVDSALATGDYFELQPGMRALHCLPSEFIAGKLMWVRAFILGLHLDFVEPTTELLQGNSTYDFAAMVPLQIERSKNNLHKVKKIIIGGAPLTHSLAQQLQTIPTQFYETYGMTETLTHVAVRTVGNSVFQALPGVTFSTDARDCLQISVPRISASPIVTNDLVDLHSATSFVWLGRVDGVLNSGGVKIIPEQVEQSLHAYISSPFFIGGLPDEHLGTKVVLFVEGAPLEWEKEWEKDLTKFQIPKEVIVLPTFARTVSGKLQRKKTVEDYLNTVGN